MVQEAVSNLFQAANVFKAANQVAHYRQQAHVAASCNMIKRVISNLLATLTGSYDTAAEGVRLQIICLCYYRCRQITKTPILSRFGPEVSRVSSAVQSH